MNKEIEEILKYLKNNTYIPDETKRKYKILHRDEVNLLLSYIEQLEKENKSLKENKNEALRYISNYLALDQRYKWNDNVDEKLKLVKKFLNGREKTIAGISYEDLLRKNKQLENNRDKAIEILGQYKHYSTPTEEQNSENEDIVDNAYNILKGGSDE